MGRLIAEVHSRYRDCRAGARKGGAADQFGISVHTADGFGYDVGECLEQFPLKSLARVFLLGLVLEERGFEAIRECARNSATGGSLDLLSREAAIAATGQVDGLDEYERFAKIHRHFSSLAGRTLGIEKSLVRSAPGGAPPATELYGKLCAILVTCRDLAVMGATLANGGVQPVTGERVLRSKNAGRVLGAMVSRPSGDRILRLGLPARSSAGGGTLGVLSGQAGFAVFSSRRDEADSRARGRRVLSALEETFQLGSFLPAAGSGESIRRSYHLGEIDPKRRRPRLQRETIRAHGEQIRVIEMQGALHFCAMERLLRAVARHQDRTRLFVIDFRHAAGAEAGTAPILETLALDLSGQGKGVVFVDPNSNLEMSGSEAHGAGFLVVDDLDAALEMCEEKLVRRFLGPPLVSGLVPFYDFEIFDGLDSCELSAIEDLLEMEVYSPGEVIAEEGAEACAVYLLAKGSASTRVPPKSRNGSAPGERPAEYLPGVVFGDLTLIEGGTRPADIAAEERSICYLLTAERLGDLERDRPALYAKLLRNLLRLNVSRIRSCHREIQALER